MISVARRVLLAMVAGTSVLAGCSNSEELSPLSEPLRERLPALMSRSPDGPTAAPTTGFPAVPPAVVAQQQGPVVGAYLANREAFALLTPSGQRAHLVTWLTPDKVSMTLANGAILMRTSGLGHDLAGAEVSQLMASIAAGQGGAVQREHVYLSRDFAQVRERFACDLTRIGDETLSLAGRAVATVKFEERCRGDEDSFTNVYWRDAGSARVVQSEQWVHPRVGKVYLQLLNQ